MYVYLIPKQCTIAKNDQKPGIIDRKQANQTDTIAVKTILD